MADQKERDETIGIYEAPENRTVIFEHDEEDPDGSMIIEIERNQGELDDDAEGPGSEA